MCVVLGVLAATLLIAAISENKLANRVERLEKALINYKSQPQRVDIKYIK